MPTSPGKAWASADGELSAQALSQAAMKLGEAMYQAQQAGAAGGAAEGAAAEDGVVDAEFEEVDDEPRSA